MLAKNPVYRYCVVPECKNTSIRTPKKLFFSIPTGKELRRNWCSAMGRKRLLRPNTNCFCCEDHFDIEKDMENYMKWKLFGVSKLLLKKGILPHKFACQNYMSVKETQTPQLDDSLHIKEEISDSESTVSCGSDTLSCDSETEARFKNTYDVKVKKEIVHEPLPEIEQIDNVDPLAIEDTSTDPLNVESTKPYIVNMVYVADVKKKKKKEAIIKN